MVIAIDKDAEVYTKVIQAYRLPKETTDEISIREQAIQQATLEAISIPYDVTLAAYDGLCELANLIPFANKNAVSDVVMAIYLFACVVECSVLNMKINISALTDENKVNEYNNEIERLLTNSSTKKQQLLELSSQFI